MNFYPTFRINVNRAFIEFEEYVLYPHEVEHPDNVIYTQVRIADRHTQWWNKEDIANYIFSEGWIHFPFNRPVDRAPCIYCGSHSHCECGEEIERNELNTRHRDIGNSIDSKNHLL